MKTKIQPINLIPQRQKKFTEKVVYFLLHYLRYILVLTQIVVIFVFFLRFKIDQEVIDLEESFNQKQEILKLATPILDEAQAFSRQEKDIGLLLDSQILVLADINYVLTNIPSAITLLDFTRDSEKITVKGRAISAAAIKQLFQKFQSDKKYKNVVIHDVVGVPSQGYEFSLEIMF